jgi:hypothetical protein
LEAVLLFRIGQLVVVAIGTVSRSSIIAVDIGTWVVLGTLKAGGFYNLRALAG